MTFAKKIKYMKNPVLLTYAKHLVIKERELQVEFLKALHEIDRRRLYAEAGCSSLYTYLTGSLNYSESCAYVRVSATRVCARFSRLYALLGGQQVNLTILALIAGPLLKGHSIDLIDEVIGKTKKEVEALLAGRNPAKSDQPDRFNNIGVEKGRKKDKTTNGASQKNLSTSQQQGLDFKDSPKTNETPQDEEILVRVSFVTSQNVTKKIDRVKELLARKYPNGKMDDLLEELLDFYIEKKDPLQLPTKERKKSPKKSPPPGKVAVKKEPRAPSVTDSRKAHQKSEGRCEWTNEQGIRCQERKFLDRDHKIPYAKGGSSKVHNIRILCRAHNALESRRAFNGRSG